MRLYNKYILPKVVDWTCRQKSTMNQRIELISLATGNVLEIGVGSGLNLPFYNGDNIKHLTGIDPSVEMWRKRVVDTTTLPFVFNFEKAFAENIPKKNNSFDTVVITYTLCTIPNINKAFKEIRRVLKPHGRLLFCEHGKALNKNIQKWQNRINPFWKRLGGGCNLNRDIPLIIEENGFKITKMQAKYIAGWKIASYNYSGIAEPN
ncbi:class I SAM-dependent methyltransferase [Lutibacter sp. TH_r2]|uniref:class I SAM-dependent methyltransferase n=1 Tax=Lutibacter sp. TH_r2 TaxID=3082083 RepID=UPI00295573D8|nr:class I SAM-dependent methyltransferase [Lutibacter sp. TH_r2]MDV7188033.1 class I SAM-dependent methyltransferase [Lutibacter sp. TH_r2]